MSYQSLKEMTRILILGFLFSCSVTAQSANKTSHSDTHYIVTDQPLPSCSPWFFWNESSRRCDCGPVNFIRCNQLSTWLDWTMCMTYDKETGSTTVAECPYHSLRAGEHKDPILLPRNRSQLNEAVCGKANRERFLCSQCKPGYGPAVLSYGHECAPCSGSFGWLLYLCAALIPTTVFFIVIVVCQVRTTSPPLNFFVFTSQMITIVVKETPNAPGLHLDTATRTIGGIAATLLTMWNLDFFPFIIPPFCVSENLSNLQVLCMDYIVALYPLLLTVIMYVCIQQHARGCRVLVCLWKPFAFCFSPLTRRFNWNPATSIVHIFASFLLLSSTKILFVSGTLLQRVVTTQLSDVGGIIQHTDALYYDPNLTIFSRDHLPYAILAILVSTVFVILPCLLLIVYPTRLFQKFLNCSGIRWHTLHAFADAFNGSYKYGTNGSRDYRCFAGFYLLLRVLWCTSEARVVHSSVTHSVILPLISAAIIFALASPYRNRLYNVLDTFGLWMMILWGCIKRDHRALFNAIALVYLFMYLIVYISFKLVFACNCKLSRKLKALGDRMAGTREESHNEEEERQCADADCLPHRLLDPGEYCDATEVTENHQSWNNNITIRNYGSMQ